MDGKMTRRKYILSFHIFFLHYSWTPEWNISWMEVNLPRSGCLKHYEKPDTFSGFSRPHGSIMQKGEDMDLTSNPTAWSSWNNQGTLHFFFICFNVVWLLICSTLVEKATAGSFWLLLRYVNYSNNLCIKSDKINLMDNPPPPKSDT